MLERFLDKVDFESYDDFMQNFHIKDLPGFNFAYDVVDEWARIEPDRKALLWTNEAGDVKQFTFADIKRESDKTAAYFQQLGIGRGDMVMLIMKRRYQFWFAITALHKLGAVAIPATHLLTDEDIVYRCQSASIRAIVAVGDDVVLDHIQKAAPDCPSVKNYISIGPKVPEGWCDFNAGIESAPPFVRPEVVNEPGDISLMYFTSGTSGEPKMVAHDFRYPLGHIITAKYWHNLDENSLHFTLADTGWGKAVWGKYYGQWIVGANVFVYDFEKFHPVDVLEMIHKFHITSFCAPPTVYRFLIREDVKKYDISSLKYCTNAGEALNPNVFERWYELTGIKLHEAFGQTETTATVGTYPWIEPRPGSMGKPNPGYDIDLITADGQVAEDGQQGEIIIRTHGRRPEGLFLGYYRDPELTHKNFHDGIYHTGDIAWRDEDGYYWFVGRKDDVIKSSGYRIGPFEVENALMKHEAVVECAVTGVPDEVRGMAVKATVVLSKEFADTPGIEYDVEYRGKEVPALVKDIQDFVKRTTAPYKYPRVIQFVHELPKTISGKIRRVEIRQKDGERS
ncbi:MAG: AMP-binding protein [Sodaliphilus sp.]|nr:AMP-binding protein [Bacteroidales bacterium]MDY3136489.1 AMP-binding protein [Sodaliphilus sp.]MDD7017085.1 AMP-binding protein [Bacteroidales bacterium]MDD7137611.1 AMP-binding protein [Bacteroidales bacterium]MDD7191616.1 AMP-binding protein [Bacteroidales bacterium]